MENLLLFIRRVNRLPIEARTNIATGVCLASTVVAVQAISWKAVPPFFVLYLAFLVWSGIERWLSEKSLIVELTVGRIYQDKRKARAPEVSPVARVVSTGSLLLLIALIASCFFG